MNKIIEPTNPMQGVGFGQTATVDLPIGRRYHALRFEIIATGDTGKTLSIADVCSLINIKIGGKVQRSFTPSELSGIYGAYGAGYAVKSYNYDGSTLTLSSGAIQTVQQAKKTMFIINVFFAEPWRKSYSATESLAWYTAWKDGTYLKSFQAELVIPTISANVKSADGIVINCYSETDNAVGPLDDNKQPIQLITRWERTQVGYTGTGEMPIVNLPKRDMLQQVSIFGQSGDTVTNVKIKVDNNLIRDVTNTRNFESLIGREWNASGLSLDRFDLALDYSDLPTDALNLNGVRDFQIIPNLSAASASSKVLTLISQVYGRID